MSFEKLKSEWTHEEIVDACKRWCQGSGVRWDATLEWRRRDELFDMFLTPTGKWGGLVQGHKLIYTSQQPIYKLDGQKLRSRLSRKKTPEELRRESIVTSRSAGHVWIRPKGRIRKGKSIASKPVRKEQGGSICQIGQRVEKWRVAAKKSVEDLCWGVGISTDAYEEFLRGTRGLEGWVFEGIAKELGTTVRDLMGCNPGDRSRQQSASGATGNNTQRKTTQGRKHPSWEEKHPTGSGSRVEGEFDADAAAALLAKKYKVTRK